MNVFDNCYLKMGENAPVYATPDPTTKPIGSLPKGYVTHSLYSKGTDKGNKTDKVMFRIAYEEGYGWVYGGDVHKVSIYGFDVVTKYVTLDKRIAELERLIDRINRQKCDLNKKIRDIEKLHKDRKSIFSFIDKIKGKP